MLKHKDLVQSIDDIKFAAKLTMLIYAKNGNLHWVW